MKIVCIGSSSVEGIGDRRGIGWTGRLNEYLQENNDVSLHRVFNLGLKGDTIAGTIERYHSEALLRRPDLVIIFTGSNDCMRTMKDGKILKLPNRQDYTFKWSSFLPKLRNAKHQTIILGPTKVDEGKGPFKFQDVKISFENTDLAEYNKEIKHLAKRHEIEFLELFDLFDENLEELTFDFVHPNEKGYDLISQHLINYLKEKQYV